MIKRVMPMYYIYLFETKSIQNYLGRTGQLKDLIAISDQLDHLIDEGESDLYEVLEQLNISHNINDVKKDNNSSSCINFFRCKGGAFGCYSTDESDQNGENIKAFARLWILFFQNKFPYMNFASAIKTGIDFHKTLTECYEALGEDFNTPKVFFPIATSIIQSSSRTGCAAIYKSKSENQKLGFDSDEWLDYDIATLVNRLPKQNLQLFKKFLGKSDESVATEYLNAFKKFQDKANDENRDFAIIHLDGNGIGQTLMKLKEGFSKLSAGEYTYKWRLISKAIASATSESVQQTINELIELKNKDSNGESKLIFRPLVLGGDDVTLLIEPKYAALFCLKFCQYFKQLSKEKLSKTEINQILKVNDNDLFLSASGGLLFNKINHPYNNSLRLVEGLAELAKKLTKSNKKDGQLAGPAAISIFRISSTSCESINEIIRRFRTFSYRTKGDKEHQFLTGLTTYLVDDQNTINTTSKDNNSTTGVTDLNSLNSLLSYVQNDMSRNINAKYRKILGELAKGNRTEAENIFDRYAKIQNKKSEKWYITPDQLSGAYSGFFDLKYKNKEIKYITSLDDILVLYHYMKESDECNN